MKRLQSFAASFWFFLLLVHPALAPALPVHTDLQIRLKYREIEERSLSHKESLTADERLKLFDVTRLNPVASLSDENIAKYDPQGAIGFCFGRSMATHLIARSQFSLASPSIRFVFIMGDLRSGADPEWRFHATAVVKGSTQDGSNEWYAIDPIFSAPLSLNNWITQVQNLFDKNKKAKFYFTENSAILPDLSTFISLKDRHLETGDTILELKFDPLSKEGFKKYWVEKSMLYQVEPQVASQYFYTLESNAPKNPFNFIFVTVNQELISYNQYFSDLVDSIYYFVPSNEDIL